MQKKYIFLQKIMYIYSKMVHLLRDAVVVFKDYS